MKNQSYSQFDPKEMILRDYLAADRTVLANERTFLAYVRTATAFAAGGVSLIHFIAGPVAALSGITLMIVGVVTLVWGFHRFIETKNALDRIRKGGGEQSEKALGSNKRGVV